MYNSPHACRDQPADPDVVHPGAHQHPCAVSAARHGMPYGASEETEEGGSDKNKRGEVLWRSGNVWEVVTEPDHPWYKMGMDVHWTVHSLDSRWWRKLESCLRVSLWSAKSDKMIRGQLSTGIKRYPRSTKGLCLHSLGRSTY